VTDRASPPESGTTPEPGPAPEPEPSSEPGVSRVRELFGALIVYLMLAYILTASTWTEPTNRWIGRCCDQEQSMWFLAWMPTALELGQNPLLTDRLNAPDGANLMWNTSQPLIALVMAPLTQALGPIFSYNVVVLAAIALSGLACFAAVRRYAKSPLGPLVGGALYALSPYMASHTALHLSLITAWAPPLFLLVLDELLVRRRYRPELLGIALALIGTLQLLTFEEVLATSAVAGALLVVVVALVVRERAAIFTGTQRLLRAALPGAVAFVVLVGVPLAIQFLGPQRVQAPVQPTKVFSTDLLNVLLPTSYQLIAPDVATNISKHFSGLFHEATGYVGVPLLLALSWVIVACRRDRRVVVAAIVGLAMLVFSFGPELYIAGESSHVPMPWQPIGSLPLLEHALPGRLTLYMWLAIAALVAIGIDHAAAMDRRRAGMRLALVGIGLVSVLPAPASSSTHEVPAFFRSWEQQGVADDEIVLFAPWFYNGAGADPMLWAAFAQARPRMHEGYVYVPNAEGRPQYGPSPGRLSQLMIDVQDHGVVPTLTTEDRAGALRELADVGISVVIVGPMQHREEMVAMLTDVLGRSPEESGGVQLWRNLPH
jgi:hypothetical protein